MTLRTRFRKVIPDPPVARRTVVAVLGRKPLLPGELAAVAELARSEDVVLLRGLTDGPPQALEHELAGRLPGRALATIVTEVVVDPDGAEPVEIAELAAVKLLVEGGALVVCLDVEEGVDRDLAGELLARRLGADDLLLLTDVPAVQIGWGTSQARTIHRATPRELRGHDFDARSIGPKVEAACRFVERTGGTAAIGAVHDAAQILAGTAGTIVRRDLY